MLQHKHDDPEFLTASEIAEVTRIRNESDVVSYAVFDMEGEQIEAGGAWSDMLAPVFSNASDIAHRLGDKLGSDDPCAKMHFAGADFETVSITLSAAQAVFVKRKSRNMHKGLRSVC